MERLEKLERLKRLENPVYGANISLSGFTSILSLSSFNRLF
jgi:hypothetical protein